MTRAPDSLLLPREYVVVDAFIALDHGRNGEPFPHSSRAFVLVDGCNQRKCGGRLSYAVDQKASDAMRNHFPAGTAIHGNDRNTGCVGFCQHQTKTLWNGIQV